MPELKNVVATSLTSYFNHVSTWPDKSYASRRFSELITLNKQNFKGVDIAFCNCEFEQDVIIDDIELSGGIIFVGCVFHGDIRITRCKIGIHNQLRDFDTSESIVFEGCICKRQIHISLCKEVKSLVRFIDGTEAAHIEVDDCVLEKSQLEFRRIKTTNLHVSKVTGLEQLSLIGSEISYRVFFNENKTSALIIRENSLKNLYIRESEVMLLNVNDNLLSGELDYHNSGGKLISIQNNTFGRRARFEKFRNQILQLELVANTAPQGFFMSGEYFEQERQSIRVEDLSIAPSNISDGTFELSDFVVDKVKLSGTLAKGGLRFLGVTIRQLHVVRFINTAKLAFINLSSGPEASANSELHIYSSHFGDTQFFNCNLIDYRSVQISSSDLSSVSAINCQWFHLFKVLAQNQTLSEFPPNKGRSRAFDFYDEGFKFRFVETHHLEERREIFRQLKLAMEKQGDRIMALKFRRFEMIAFAKYMESLPFWNGDRVILLLSRTNNFGQNWYKPIGWMLGVTLLFTVLLIISVEPTLSWAFSFSKNDILHTASVVWVHIGIYWALINPIRYLDKVLSWSGDISGFTFFLDYLHRILLSFFIFQTVSAFRKFVK